MGDITALVASAADRPSPRLFSLSFARRSPSRVSKQRYRFREPNLIKFRPTRNNNVVAIIVIIIIFI